MQDYPVVMEDVTFGYNEDHPILNGISLTIPRGKTVAIMGGSGSGKTTLLKLIAGQIKPQAG
ncbi:MAG: ATP-binding cassette domain-containing protein, partial [Burkholderiales bacterium]